MAIPSLPASGSTDWYAWATGVDGAARDVASKADSTALTAKATATAVEGIKVHDGTAGGGTRPSGFARVRWVGGTARPTNMVTGDIWEHDAP